MSQRILLVANLLLLCLVGTNTTAQNVAINNSGATPDTSAILDVQSTTKGVLIPRLTSSQRTSMSVPAVGLLVFDSDTETFWFKESTGWVELVSGNVHTLADADSDTYIDAEQSPDEDTIRFKIAGTELAKMDNKTFHLEAAGASTYIGTNAGTSDNGTAGLNTAIGFEALKSNDMGAGNTAIGYQSLKAHNSEHGLTAVGYKALTSNTSGGENSAFGYGALQFNSTGTSNSAFGDGAMTANVDGDYNTALGYNALNSTTSSSNTGLGSLALQDNGIGSSNVAVGMTALFRNTEGNYNVGVGAESNMLNYTGSNNVMIGYQAGRGTIGHSKSGNVFIGYKAGYFSQSSNRLIIENSNDVLTPLIYGEFDNNIVGIYGALGVGTGSPGKPLHVKEDGVDSVQTIIAVLESSVSSRPVLLFSETTANTFNDGMSIEYNGAAGFGGSNEMYINKTGGGSMVTFENSGDVGIATTEPVTKLHVTGGSDSGLASGGYVTIGPVTGSNISMDDNEIMARNNGAASDLFFQMEGGSLNVGTFSTTSKVNIASGAGVSPLHARINGSIKLLVHDNGGTAIGANTAPPANGLYVQGDILYNGAFASTSDGRYKKDITVIHGALDALSNIDGVRYKWRRSEFPEKGFSDEPQIGFIAQNIEQHYPELVKTNTDGFKSVEYIKMIPVLVEAIKELEQRNAALAEQVNTLLAEQQVLDSDQILGGK